MTLLSPQSNSRPTSNRSLHGQLNEHFFIVNEWLIHFYPTLKTSPNNSKFNTNIYIYIVLVFFMFAHKPKPNPKPLLCLFQNLSSLDQIKQTHAQIIVLGLTHHGKLMSHLLASLALSHQPTTPSPPLHYSFAIYRSFTYPSIFVTNNMIRCFAKSQSPLESINLYSSILHNFATKPNNHTFTFVLQACSKALALLEGNQVHAHVVKLGFGCDVFIRNALINFYHACCGLECSRRVFEEDFEARDLVTWNTMLACYVRDGHIGVAEKMFGEMPERDVVSWSTMLTGYVQHGFLEEALACFKGVRETGMRLNEAVLVSVLSVSAQLGLLEHGKLVHSIVQWMNFPITSTLGASLIDMYAKCGCIEESKLLFDNMPQKDVWTWNVMISGLAAHGLGEEAVELFEKFVDKGFSPSNITFVGVLNACSRAGLVREGQHYFKLMRESYGIEPEMEHYGCMVDLLSRPGFVDEAIDLVENMKISPDPVLWATLLGACKIHGHIELGEKIGNKLIQLDPNHGGHYVQLSSVYAKARKWEEVVRVRRLMSERNTNKAVGWSLIEAQGKVHKFVAGDRDHERVAEIYKMLELIGTLVAESGYSPNVASVLHDIGEEEKESVIKEHSERLAIAYGLLVTRVGDCIRIVKNLRVCEDCHEVTKIISKVFEREIIVRDGSRFHHFKDGKCSCHDFW